MPIILFGGEKGGTGKSTLATNIAVMRARAGHDVLLLDTDKQATSSKWASVREEEVIAPGLFAVQKFGKGIPALVQDLQSRYDDIIIDAGGRDNPELRYALAIAEKAYIPVLPSDFDAWTIRDMDRLIEMAQSFNPDLTAYIVISRASTHPQSREADGTREDILGEQLEQLTITDTVIFERVAYRKAARNGKAVVELSNKDRDEKAIFEIEALYKEVFVA
ncbi:MAG: chromosome partitioning protein [Deltaproteobacteria bacterium RIFOXYD12_FULL_50_9]|nr:MAG: chromosome partitioning protein [Deltaproteobacteria bacterium RIFOXYD12_FULL_50_9]